jgi:hypothetical protein
MATPNRGKGMGMNDQVYRQNEEIVYRPENYEAILFNPENSDIIIINSTGCFIWSLCDGKNSHNDILTYMLREFDTTAEKAEADLDGFLSDMEKRQFLKKI